MDRSTLATMCRYIAMMVMGQTTWVRLDSIDFTNTTNFPAQDISGTDKGATTKTISGVFFTAKKSKTINLNNTTPGVVFNDNGDLTHAVAIPVTGVNEELKIIVYHNYNNTSASFRTAITHSTNNDPSESQTTDLAMGNSGTKNKNDYVQIQTKLTGSSYIVWATRAGSDYKTIKSIAIYTKEAAAAKDYTVTATVSGGVGGTVSAAASSLDATETTTITATPATGYQVTNWAVSGTGASIDPSGASNSNTTTLTMGSANATVTATFGPKSYTVTLNNQSATTPGTPNVTTTYNANTNLTSAITCPTKTSKVFAGYFTAANGGGVQLIDPAGNWIASAGGGSTYLDGSKNWKNDGNLTLYACWMEYCPGMDMAAQAISLGSGEHKTWTGLTTNKILYSVAGNTTFDDSSDASNAYDGLKFKNNGDYILFLVQANSSLKLYFGYTDTKPKISINGGAESTVDVGSTGSKTPNQEVDFGTQTYDRLIKLRTVTSSTVVLQKIEITAPSCTAPNHVDVAATSEAGNYGWRYTIGETMKLTAKAYSTAGTSNEITSGLTYQWKKKTGESTWKNLTDGVDATDGGTFSGTTSANLVISGLTAGNAGTYKCEVSTGTGCTTTSNEYWVRVFTLDGNYSGQSWVKHPIVWTDEYNGTVTLTNINANSTYKFKVTDNDSHWYGKNTAIYKDQTNYWAYREDGTDIELNTGIVSGTYTISVDVYHANDDSKPYCTLKSVNYPKRDIYMELCDDWNKDGAKFAIYYFRNADSDNDKGWTDLMTTYTCNSSVMHADDVPSWADRYIFVRLSSDATVGTFDKRWNQTGDVTPDASKDYYHTMSGTGNSYSGTWGTIPTYTISFAANGGSGSMSSISSIACDADQALTANSFTKTGYSFAGWKADVNVKIGGETISAGTVIANQATIQEINNDITLTAQWTCIDFTPARGGTEDGTYTVGEDGGTLTCSVAAAGDYTYQWKQYTSGQTPAAAVDAVGTGATSTSFTPHPTVAGTYYYFCEVTNSCDVKKTTSTSGTFVFNEAVTLYTVTYNANGGSVTPTSATQASAGAAITLTTPTWIGYTIEGWYNNGTKIGNAGDSYTPTADITLYAHWTDNIDGKLFSYVDGHYGDKCKAFDLSGWVSSDQGGSKDKTYTNGTTGIELNIDDGGWDNKSATTSIVAPMIKFIGTSTTKMSVTIPSGKHATITILYGSYSKNDKYLKLGDDALTNPTSNMSDPVASTSGFATVTLTDKTGTVNGFTTNSGNVYIAKVSATITGYTVTYAKGTADGASGDSFTGTKTAGSAFTLSSSSSAFTRDGYTYDGWSTNADGSTKDYNLGGSYTTDAVITLYPHWVTEATVSATLLTPEYMATGSTGVQIGVEITGASSGWYYRVKKGAGYETPDNTTYATTTWTMTSTIGAGANTYMVELYNGSGIKMAESNSVTVTGETGHPMTILAGANGTVSQSGTIYANGDHLHPEITATPNSGYHFVNWTLSNANATLDDATSAETTITSASGACTITANFEADVVGHTVTYNYNGATSGASPTSATGASVTLPTPTRTGYELDGWYTTAGEKVGAGGATYNPTADITLYARWEEECDAGGVSKSTTDVAASGYTTYQEVGGSNVVFTSTPSLKFKYKTADGTLINNPSSTATLNNAYSCQIKSNSSNKGSIKTNSTFSNVDSISFYFAASDKNGCKIAVWYSTDNFSTDSTSLLSATAIASSRSNEEFIRKVIAIPSDKKANTLTFKFRFTADGSGKTCYIDSLKVYSSTTGGSTCYHVYYHGNGAESGYVNDTVSYTAGSKATVLNYNYGRYPLAKAGNDFQGWATSASSAVAYSAGQKIDITSADVHLYAKWATASSALVTWKMKTADNEAWATTTGTGTTDGTNISSIGTSHDEGDNKAKYSATAKTAMASGEVSSTAAPDKSARFTFTIGATKQVEISKFDCKVFNVGSGNRTYKAQISDAAGNVYNSTNTVPVTASATLTDASFVFGSGKILRGAVTIRIYAWKTSDSPTDFRMGPDVKFYGTVDNYACATPSAPTISGVSEYVPGQTITLTASHDGENYDNLTTYTWYQGANWAAASGTTPVQAAATGSAGYTFTKASCAAGDAGKYWCKVSNGTGCDAHNSEGYNIIVYPTYTITYNLNGGTNPVDPAPKTSYTRFDEDYTLPAPTKDGFVFAGWYETSDFSGLPTVVLGAGSVGDKEYWAKWGETVTVNWTVTKVDDALYRGGGSYSVKAVIDQTDWSTGFMDELELTATEGVTLKNIEVSENDESKVQVTADFDITTELAADATLITFTLNVPADGKYGPKVDEHEEDLTSCVGSPTIISIFDGTSDTENPKSSTNNKYKQSTQFTNATTGFKYELQGIKGDLIDISEATYTGRGEYTRAIQWGGASTSYYAEFIVPTGYTASITITYVLTSGSPKYIGFGTTKAAQANGSNYDINETISSNNVVGTSTFSSLSSGTYYYVCSGGTPFYILGVSATLTPSSGGITPTLTWDPALADDGDWSSDDNRLEKETGDVDFTFVAVQDKNSLGAITYSSNNPSVATVNAAGTVHIVGAQGDATITATLAESGCFEEATATYNIHVEDNCIDEPGTIAWTDLGCSGIQMTVSGHTALAGVSYQWYKVGTPDEAIYGATEATYTATAAGEYFVVVTNTGTDHCAMASTNTIKVAAKAAISVPTNIVDSWYVKNGRRTPDIALWKTTGVSTFTVKNNASGATIENIGGCTFELKDGIIYLKGTTSTGAAPSDMETGDLVIKAEVKDECGSNTKISSTITIHCQAATNYKEIAFVADGGKGMRKDSITVGHGDGTELYEYLDSVGTAAENRLFKLSERNIYWTTDEKAIREEYSRFDAILITDDPSTNTVVKTGDDYKTKGYVNAFGTMIDVRPIFTMEAYVSALKNWGSKGIAGNPQSPNPRQYEMRLECKDHEIYGSGLPDPEDGTNVWEEVIDGETFRHVILVDSTKGIYNGVAYNVETAGDKKPALQGFTGEAAGSLLGLGRILEGTLQAAIERQEKPAARLLVFGINAKALHETCALTDEGKVVIRNILTYLLKTNMEEVDDCSNYFKGGTVGKERDWNTASNWAKNTLPTYETKVRILAPCEISNAQVRVAQVDIATRGTSSNIPGGTCSGQLTIMADGALVVGGKVRTAEAPYFAANDLKPTTVNDLIINTDGSGQGALIFDNSDGDTKATVNLYSLGRKSDGHYQFQYYAVPMTYIDVNPAFAGSGIYTYVWNEASGWERRGYYTGLEAFEGVGITTKFADARSYQMKGTLASTATKEITLTHENEGHNLIGNSWTAPIQISQLEEDNSSMSNKTVYIYNTGNDDTADDGYGTGAGQWTAIPFNAAGFDAWDGLKVIPAMQAFEIVPDEEETLTLDYDKVVRGDNQTLTEPLRAPRKVADHAGIELMRIRVAESNAHADLYLFEGSTFSDEFDNGWEAAFMDGDGPSAQLYADVALGRMAVVATDELEGTFLGFVPGQETTYTFSFGGAGMGYYLNDLKLKTSTLINAENSYTFTFEEGDANRFYISSTPIEAPQTPTGVDNTHSGEVKAQKFIYNDKMYIMINGRIYSAEGQIVK